MKVLYVDGDAQMRDYVSMYLETGLDCEILEASSGNEALAVMEMEPDFNLIVTEVEMKGGNANVILDFLDLHKIQVPIVFISDIKNKESMCVVERLGRSKNHGFIPKPFKDPDFFPVIENAVNFVASTSEICDNPEKAATEDDWAKATEKAGDADWSLKMEKKDAGTSDADWTEKKPATDWGDLKDKKVDIEELSKRITTDVTKEILLKSKKLREEERESDEDFDKSKYKRVRIMRFLNFSDVPCDVFIKLPSKYLKMINLNEEYDPDRIEKYKQKKVRYLYVPTGQHEALIDKFGDEVFKALDNLGDAPVEKRNTAELAAFEHVLGSCKEFGIDEKTSKKITRAINSQLKTVSKMKGSSGILEMMEKVINGADYISEHSLMISYISGQICMATDWGSTAALEKLSMAALLHDGSFTDSHLATIHDLDKTSLTNISEKEKEFINEHAGLSASLVSGGKNIFPDVDVIIAQHHENPEGTGYPRKLGSLSISPLSCIFIIAEAFVSQIYGKSKADIDMDNLKNEFQERFDKGNFKKPLKAFLKVF